MKTVYKVKFEFQNEFGEWRKDNFTNNGKGFTIKEANEISADLNGRKWYTASLQVRNVEIVEYTPAGR